MAPTFVIKVGGSLFDLPDLKQRLETWLSMLSNVPYLLVPGGGETADVIRTLDVRHSLGEETAHWLALRSLTLNAHFLASLLPRGVVIDQPQCRLEAWNHHRIPIADPHAFMLHDELNSQRLPHLWQVTSDSVAARIACMVSASELILLKSIDVPDDATVDDMARQGWVDTYFPRVVSQSLGVRVVNLRRM